MGEGKKLQIRNSTVDFLVFTKDAEENGIEVRVQDENVWLTQKAIGQLFDIDRSVVTKHLKKIFTDGELEENSTCAFFAQVADNGKWDKGKVTAAIAKAFAESEFEQYRIIQDQLYQSDFDRLIAATDASDAPE